MSQTEEDQLLTPEVPIIEKEVLSPREIATLILNKISNNSAIASSEGASEKVIDIINSVSINIGDQAKVTSIDLSNLHPRNFAVLVIMLYLSYSDNYVETNKVGEILDKVKSELTDLNLEGHYTELPENAVPISVKRWFRFASEDSSSPFIRLYGASQKERLFIARKHLHEFEEHLTKILPQEKIPQILYDPEQVGLILSKSISNFCTNLELNLDSERRVLIEKGTDGRPFIVSPAVYIYFAMRLQGYNSDPQVANAINELGNPQIISILTQGLRKYPRNSNAVDPNFIGELRRQIVKELSENLDLNLVQFIKELMNTMEQ